LGAFLREFHLLSKNGLNSIPKKWALPKGRTHVGGEIGIFLCSRNMKKKKYDETITRMMKYEENMKKYGENMKTI